MKLGWAIDGLFKRFQKKGYGDPNLFNKKNKSVASDADQFSVDFICSFVNHPRLRLRLNFLFWAMVLVILDTKRSCAIKENKLRLTLYRQQLFT